MSPLDSLGHPPFEQALNHATGVFSRLVSPPARDALDVAVFVTLVTVVIATGFVQNGLLSLTTVSAVLGENAAVLPQVPVG